MIFACMQVSTAERRAAALAAVEEHQAIVNDELAQGRAPSLQLGTHGTHLVGHLQWANIDDGRRAANRTEHRVEPHQHFNVPTRILTRDGALGALHIEDRIPALPRAEAAPRAGPARTCARVPLPWFQYQRESEDEGLATALAASVQDQALPLHLNHPAIKERALC